MPVELFKKKITIKNNNSDPIKKKILLYQKGDFHSEISGCFIYNLYKSYTLYVYYPNYKSSNNYFNYYENELNVKLNFVDIFNEDIYDYIIMLTSREIELLKPKNINKFILIKHVNEDNYDNYINISLTKIVKSYFNIMPIYNTINNYQKHNVISIIGNMSSTIVRDLEGLIELSHGLDNYDIYIFTRKIDAKYHNIYNKNNKFKIFINLNVHNLMQKLKQSKFIITADTDYYSNEGFKTGVLTGMIPLALNNDIPLIMSKKLNNIYQLKNVIEYDKMTDVCNILNSLSNTEYNILQNGFIENKKYILNHNSVILNNILKF